MFVDIRFMVRTRNIHPTIDSGIVGDTVHCFQVNGMQEEEEEVNRNTEEVRWEGEVSVEIEGHVEDVWRASRSFVGLDKWCSYIQECHVTEGEDCKVGCMRYCGGTFGQELHWANEVLVSYDEQGMAYSYSYVDGSLPLRSLLVSFSVSPPVHVHDLTSEPPRSVVSWRFQMDPEQQHGRLTYQAFMSLLSSSYHNMATGLQTLVVRPSSPQPEIHSPAYEQEI